MLTFKLLGELTILDGEQTADIVKSDKAVALLAYLIYTRERKSREHVADLLWDSDSTHRSLKNLRHLLSKMLRPHVPELLIEPKHLSLPLNGNATVDLYQLEAALEDGGTAVLDQALSLYTGDFLGDFYLRGAPYFNEWLVSAQELLRQRVLMAYHTLCAEHIAHSRWRRAATAALQWRQIDVFNEEALRYLIRALAADGQFGAAQHHYAAFRTFLWDEMVLEPEPQTIQLVEEIETQRSEMEETMILPIPADSALIELDLAQLSDPGPLPPQSLLPYPRNKLFEGREADLLRLAAELVPTAERENQVPQAVAITGMGGLGKSQLAVEFAYRYGRYFPGGVYWISFANSQEVVDQITKIGGADGLQLFLRADNLTQADKIGRILTAWQEMIPRLLIFDNCEDETLLSKWMPVSGGCSILLTSRHSSWPAQLPLAELALGEFDPLESAHFLQQLVTHIEPKEALSIANELGHLPLALHLSGSFLRRYTRISTDQYLQQLRDKALLHHPSLSGYGVTFSPTGHELSVARTFALSWDQLDVENEVDYLALRLLSTIVQFAPGEPVPTQVLYDLILDGDTDVWAELRVEDSLLRLVSLGFVRLSGTEFVTIHRLVVSFVEHSIDKTALLERHSAVAQHLIYLTDRHRETVGIDLYTLPISSTHFRYVLDMAVEMESAYAVPLMGILGIHLTLVDLPAARPCLENIIALADKQFGEQTPQMVYAMYCYGYLLFREGQLDESYELGIKTLELCTNLGIDESLDKALTLYGMGYIDIRLNQIDKAKQRIHTAIQMYESLYGDASEYVGNSLKLLASAYAMHGEYEQALAYISRSVIIFRQKYGENHVKIGDTYSTIGAIHGRRGDFAKMDEFCQKSLRVNETIFGSTSVKIYGPLTNLGVCAWRNGDYETAYSRFVRGLEVAREYYPADHYVIAEALSNTAEVLCKLERFDEAMDYHQQAFQIRSTAFGEDHFETMRSLSMVGEVRLRMGEVNTAVEILTRCEEIQLNVESDPQAITDTQVWLGEALQAAGDFKAAENAFMRALSRRQEAYGDSNTETVQAILCLGKLFEAVGHVVKAERFYEQGLEAINDAGADGHPLARELKSRLVAL